MAAEKAFRVRRRPGGSEGAREGHGKEKEYSAHRNPEVRKRTPVEDADIDRWIVKTGSVGASRVARGAQLCSLSIAISKMYKVTCHFVRVPVRR